MSKTGGEIEADLFAFFQESDLKTGIGGEIFKKDQRPLDSQAEDAVVAFLAGRNEQIQAGVVNLNIYTPDIDSGHGRQVINSKRTRELELLINGIIEAANLNDYRLKLENTVQTYQVEGIEQHFINARITFKLITF